MRPNPPDDFTIRIGDDQISISEWACLSCSHRDDNGVFFDAIDCHGGLRTRAAEACAIDSDLCPLIEAGSGNRDRREIKLLD